MNTANKLTVFRIILIPFFVLFMLTDFTAFNRLIALILFITASITDQLDGHIARKYNMITSFGKFMDPIADKLLVSSALICLSSLGELPAWVVIVIILREFAISGLRVFGYGNAPVPTVVNAVTCERLEDERMMTVSWDESQNAEGYMIRFGINPDELNQHYMIQGQTSIMLRCLNKGVDYYVRVDAYNESGMTVGTKIVKVPTRL